MDRPGADHQGDRPADREAAGRLGQEADHQAVGLPIAAAARALGVSENAVRQRIKRGTVDACKVDGIWHVQVETGGDERRPSGGHEPTGRSDHQGDRHHRPPADQEADRPLPAVPAAARAQLAAIVEEMIAPLVAAHEERTAALARDLGRAEAERDQIASERAALRAEVARLRAVEDAPETRQDAPHATQPTDPAPLPPRPWWRRLVDR